MDGAKNVELGRFGQFYVGLNVTQTKEIEQNRRRERATIETGDCGLHRTVTGVISQLTVRDAY